HRFERTQTTELPFDRHAQLVGHFDHTAGDFDVVFVIGNGLAVFHQRTVHHDAGETQVDGALADGGRLTVVLVHDHGNVGVGLDGGLDQVLEKTFTGVLAGACGGLHDDRAVGFCRRFHDGLDLLQVVDIECRNAVAVFGCVIQQLTHGN